MVDKKLWDQIGRKRSYVITSGTKEVWASAVVYVIAPRRSRRCAEYACGMKNCANPRFRTN